MVTLTKTKPKFTTGKTNKSKTTISIKVDKDLKKKVDQFSDSIGIPVSTMVNTYFAEIVLTRVFIAAENPELSELSKKMLRESIAEYKRGEYEKSGFQDFIKKAKTGKL